MKQNKRVLSAFLALIMLATLLPAPIASAAGAENKNAMQDEKGGAYTAQESDLMHTRATQIKRQAHALFFLPSCGNGRNVV